MIAAPSVSVTVLPGGTLEEGDEVQLCFDLSSESGTETSAVVTVELPNEGDFDPKSKPSQYCTGCGSSVTSPLQWNLQ